MVSNPSKKFEIIIFKKQKINSNGIVISYLLLFYNIYMKQINLYKTKSKEYDEG